MTRILRLALALVLFTVVLATPSMESGAGVAAQAPGAQWEATIEMSSDRASLAQAMSIDLADALQIDGVTAIINGSQLALAGGQGIEQLRRALFDDAAGWVDLLGGPVELSLELPSGQPRVLLRLEARTTTGYRWQLVSAGSEARHARRGESTFAHRYRGLGAPSIQTIRIRPGGTGDPVVRLRYERPFEADAPAHAWVSIRVTDSTGIIELSDPTPAEPAASQAIFAEAEPGPEAALPPAALPASLDWRTSGIVPAVRDQGGCGSCWAFGTVGIMESAIKKAGGSLTDLSEQFLVSCNKDGWNCADGGWTAHKYHYNTLGKSQTKVGAVLESEKPYTSRDGTCRVALGHPYILASWKFITGSESKMPTVEQIKTAIYTYGPVTAGVCADSGWDAYSGGVYNPTSNKCDGSTDHQIILVGWDDAESAWILRNSWGAGWGENGYMRIGWDTTGRTSRVGEGTSWVQYKGTGPLPVPTTYTPSGNITTNRPTYVWSRISAATSYQLQIYDTVARTYRVSQQVGSSSCNASTNRCSYRPSTTLTYNRSHKWRVSAGAGAYSAWRTFKPVH